MFDILSPKTKLSKPSRRNNSESNFNPVSALVLRVKLQNVCLVVRLG